ncbi:hypothetical protein [Anoxybacillus flavithermus]|uniref:hypothetical protein n=1 Tax=Anoxybacillus flavithermus TaxID=33934 RepID=UPI0018680320|nr:hypothetical protein [Anoxybacillus flavithermus]MBE2914743.1 hypothetical protein [Anoxybacillus flavithermus]
MKLTKTVYLLVENSEQIVGYNVFDEPIYETVFEKIPIKCDVEPYSSKMAENRYGIVTDVQYRLFTKPDSRLKLGEKIEYRNEKYIVTGVMDFDRHYEVLMKRDDAQ